MQKCHWQRICQNRRVWCVQRVLTIRNSAGANGTFWGHSIRQGAGHPPCWRNVPLSGFTFTLTRRSVAPPVSALRLRSGLETRPGYLLDIRHISPRAGHSKFNVECWTFNVHLPPVSARPGYLLADGRQFSPMAYHSTFNVQRSMFDVQCSMFDVRCSDSCRAT